MELGGKVIKKYLLEFEAYEKELANANIDKDILARKIQRELRYITGTDTNINVQLRLRGLEEVKKYKYKLGFFDDIKIMEVLEKGDRVELIPGKDGIKIIQESRKEIK